MPDIPCAEYGAASRDALSSSIGNCAVRLGQYRIVGDYMLPVGKPLHPNQRLLLETIWQLQPESVWEVGCGGGVNLHNLSVLLPGVRLFGWDRCAEQVEVAHEFFPSLREGVRHEDATGPAAPPIVDIAFSQAALMHIENEKYDEALRKMFLAAQRQIVLMENWFSRDFAADISRVLGAGDLWEQMHAYQRFSPEFGRYHLMILSREPLAYEPLIDYRGVFAIPEERENSNDPAKLGRTDWIRRLGIALE